MTGPSLILEIHQKLSNCHRIGATYGDMSTEDFWIKAKFSKIHPFHTHQNVSNFKKISKYQFHSILVTSSVDGFK